MHFDKTWQFITHSIQAEGRVLIHCEDGVSVAPTVLAAYLMKQHGIAPNEAIARVKRQHAVTDINTGFQLQLQEYHDRQCSYHVHYEKRTKSSKMSHEEYAAKYGLRLTGQPPAKGLRGAGFH